MSPLFKPGHRGPGRPKGSPNRKLKDSRIVEAIRNLVPDSPEAASAAIRALDVIITKGTDEVRYKAAMLLLERIAGRPKSRRLGK